MKTKLLNKCPFIWQDIQYCQNLGKTVLLSLGGAAPDTQLIANETSANNFADFLWAAFGPYDTPAAQEWVANYGQRPFLDATVDGFDFDIEHNGDFGTFICFYITPMTWS